MSRQQSLQRVSGRLSWIVASHTAACAFVFGLLHVGLTLSVLLTIPFGVTMGYAASYLRQRLTPDRYTFAVVPIPQRARLVLLISAVFLSAAVWHMATRNLMGAWSAMAMGGMLLLFIAGDFGYFGSRSRSRSDPDGELPHALEPAVGPYSDGSSSPPAN